MSALEFEGIERQAIGGFDAGLLAATIPARSAPNWGLSTVVYAIAQPAPDQILEDWDISPNGLTPSDL